MTRAKILLVAAITIPLAGCLLSGKPKTIAALPAAPQPSAPAPSEPLSIPQTDVQLPAPQKLEPGALTPDTHAEPAPPAQAKAAAPVKPPPRAAAPTPQSKPPDAAPPPPDPPAAAETTRAPIHEIMSEDERNRMRDEARAYRDQTRKLMADANPHTANQKRVKAEIEQFLKQSTDAENAGDMRLADQFAERAHILAKELQSGK